MVEGCGTASCQPALPFYSALKSVAGLDDTMHYFKFLKIREELETACTICIITSFVPTAEEHLIFSNKVLA